MNTYSQFMKNFWFSPKKQCQSNIFNSEICKVLYFTTRKLPIWSEKLIEVNNIQLAWYICIIYIMYVSMYAIDYVLTGNADSCFLFLDSYLRLNWTWKNKHPCWCGSTCLHIILQLERLKQGMDESRASLTYLSLRLAWVTKFHISKGYRVKPYLTK